MMNMYTLWMIVPIVPILSNKAQRMRKQCDNTDAKEKCGIIN